MSPIKKLLLTMALTLCWSPSYMFIKFAIEDIPPFTVVAARLILAAFIFFVILLLRKQRLPSDRNFWMHATAMALLSSAIPYSLFCFAEQSIDSAMAALLTGGAPMCTALLAHLFIPNDRLTLSKVCGIGLSFAGILLLFAPSLIHGISGTASGMVCATIAAISYGVSHVYGKKFITGQAPFVAPTAQLLCGALILLPFSLWIDSPFGLPMPSLSAIGGVLGLVFFSTLCAFTIYYRLLEYSGATAISMVGCFFPVLAMVFGFLFLGETLTLLDILASGVILAGMMLVNGVISIPSTARAKAHAR